MKAVIYKQTGGPEVLQVIDKAIPQVPPGHVRVRIAVSGVNPTDCRSRSGQSAGMKFDEQVPNQDGAGYIDAVGADVREWTVGQRVWLWDTAYNRPSGTAQEYLVIPTRHVVALPDTASFDVGASLGIPALTAYRTLTASESGPDSLRPGALTGSTVLVHGGAGAVGHAAIQLARWAGATVITTVSSPEKAQLARNAGAHHVINYRTEDVAARVTALAPDGVQRIVEIDLAANIALDVEVITPNGAISVYTFITGDTLKTPTLGLLTKNVQIDFIYTYTTRADQKEQAVAGVNAAVADGAMEVGTDHGLPIARYPLHRTAEAHAAVERGTVGKVLIDVAHH
ncbi:NADPH:quinone reductase [Rhodococcus rhodochrous]|uniref:NADPH:quinone reductase n=1 Tax=Rhodococcus rhodochrous KG-21 TaxID=1441923 RepID=A0A0M8PK45_RHORH|nr:NADPH:quinone reductase [Rhodococcus rhodochrous]KOS53308.1 NADPH:quinone reductase [Rhodococcus rhodochrous KG-21]